MKKYQSEQELIELRNNRLKAEDSFAYNFNTENDNYFIRPVQSYVTPKKMKTIKNNYTKIHENNFEMGHQVNDSFINAAVKKSLNNLQNGNFITP